MSKLVDLLSLTAFRVLVMSKDLNINAMQTLNVKKIDTVKCTNAGGEKHMFYIYHKLK
jgi:hypothetical protein